ncbi:unnamed protein product [Rotaria socialis]|uniref:Uncharacterized protein n=1 Tax=Rotaria socialis TaxID=392032 RepID=A0A821VNL9_9BILA|nr:unnamed protein product [Rotaria socialis]
MSLNINCLSEYSDFELVPLIGNNSKNFIHSIYKQDENGFISKFSSFIREKSIKLINEEFNSNIISQHFKYLLEQFNNYSKKSSSIIIDGSKSLMIKSLNNLLNDYYYIEEINLHIVSVNKYFNEINSFIDNDQNIKVLFNKITKSYEYIMKDINNLNKKLCYYINQNNIEIEKKIFYLFNLINEKFQFFIQIINEKILNKFFKSKLFNQNQQEKIQSFISLIATLFFSIILIITIVPFAFLIIIIINDFCLHSNNQTKQFKNQKTNSESSSKLDDLDVKQLISLHTHSNDSQSCYTTNSFRAINYQTSL